MKNQTHNNLYIMMGLPGSGKSYWLSKNAEGKVVSRDKIRFEMLMTNEAYFAHEKRVFNEFCKEIQNALDSNVYQNVYADATHINKKSRMKLINNLNLNNVDVHVIYIITPLDECFNNSKERTGRSYVSPKVIRDFVNRLEPPTLDEYKYKTITTIQNSRIMENKTWQVK